MSIYIALLALFISAYALFHNIRNNNRTKRINGIRTRSALLIQIIQTKITFETIDDAFNELYYKSIDYKLDSQIKAISEHRENIKLVLDQLKVIRVNLSELEKPDQEKLESIRHEIESLNMYASDVMVRVKKMKKLSEELIDIQRKESNS